MTLRRLDVLIRGLLRRPDPTPLHEALWAEQEAEQKATPDLIRERKAAWERRNAERLTKEAG